MSVFVIISLIISGIFVGFINTLAGGGTIISVSLLLFLGLPAPIANGTNRVAVFIQNIVAVRNFRKNGIIDFKKGFILAVPTILGSLLGAQIAVQIDEKILEIAIIVSMVFMIFFLVISPKKFLKGNQNIVNNVTKPYVILLFFLIGVYGGFIHIGIGYFLLVALVLLNGYDLIKANAMKNLLVMLYVPFSLIIYIIKDQVYWEYGLVHSIGNVIGAYVASKYAYKLGTSFVRYLLIILILLTVAELSGIIEIKSLFNMLLTK